MFSKINEALTALFAHFQREEGQTLSEYGLILALVAVACTAALIALTLGIKGIFADVVTALGGAVPA